MQMDGFRNINYINLMFFFLLFSQYFKVTSIHLRLHLSSYQQQKQCSCTFCSEGIQVPKQILPIIYLWLMDIFNIKFIYFAFE